MEFRPVRTDNAALSAHTGLFAECFPPSARLEPSYLDWLYRLNPEGQVQGFDAWDDGRLVATYVCVPAPIMLRGQSVRALLSLNTATAPSHQGRGLFTKLASLTYEAAASADFAVVYGVANANSIPGFSRKLGFQDVAGLDVRLAPLPVTLPDPAGSEAKAEFWRIWDETSLGWRIACPRARLSTRPIAGGTRVLGAAGPPGFRISTEVAVRCSARGPSRLAAIHLHIGMAPVGTARRPLALPLPERLKPSPLRLIYRNLHEAADRLDPERVLLRFIDFDAY